MEDLELIESLGGAHQRPRALRPGRHGDPPGPERGAALPRRLRAGDRERRRPAPGPDDGGGGRWVTTPRSTSPPPGQVAFELNGRRVDRAGRDDAGRRRLRPRRRGAGLLLRAAPGRGDRRVPHVPGRGGGHARPPDRLQHARAGRHGGAHRPPTPPATGTTASWSSCWRTTRSTARSATRAASARCRTAPSRSGRRSRASSRPSATSRSPSTSRRSSRSTASGASRASAASASATRSPRTAR